MMTTRKIVTMAPTDTKMPTVTGVDSHERHLSCDQNLQEPVSVHLHFEHNLPSVPSAQSLHGIWDVEFCPYVREQLPSGLQSLS